MSAAPNMKKTTTANRLYSLMVHSVQHSNEDAIFNPSIFEDLVEGNFVKLYDPERPLNKLILKVPTLNPVSGRLEISISKTIAESFALQPFTRVIVEQVSLSEVEVDFVEVAFRRQFLQRGHMWKFKRAMAGMAVHIHQNISIDGVSAQVQDLNADGKGMKSGVVTSKTNIIYRSRSARVFWQVQISSEMWEYDQCGNLYFEKFLSHFVDPVLDKMKALTVTHHVSIVFFTRSLIIGAKEKLNLKDQRKFGQFAAGDVSSRPELESTHYQDMFKVVAEGVVDMEKTKVLQILKKEFWDFPSLVGWNISRSPLTSDDRPSSVPVRSAEYKIKVPSDAVNGNFLEAVNTTLNLLDKHYMDRDLTRTGGAIVIISAGTGIFKVEPVLAQITKQRMMDSGIGIDFISLSHPPLHTVPLFMVLPGIQSSDSSATGGGFFEVPHWMNVSYVDCVSTTKHKHHSTDYSGSRGGMEVSKAANKEQKHKWTGKREFQNAFSLWASGKNQSNLSAEEAERYAQREIEATEGGGSSKLTVDVIQSERWARIFRPLAFSSALELQAVIVNYQRFLAARSTMAEAEAAINEGIAYNDIGSARLIVKRSLLSGLRDSYANTYLQVASLPSVLRDLLFYPQELSMKVDTLENDTQDNLVNHRSKPTGPCAQDSSNRSISCREVDVKQNSDVKKWGFISMDSILNPYCGIDEILTPVIGSGINKHSVDPYAQKLDYSLRDVPVPDLFEFSAGMDNNQDSMELQSHPKSREDLGAFGSMRRVESETSMGASVASELSLPEFRQRINSVGSVDSLSEMDPMDEFLISQHDVLRDHTTPTNLCNPSKSSKSTGGQGRKGAIQRLSGKSLNANDVQFFQQLMSRGVSCDDLLMKAIINTSSADTSLASDLNKTSDKADEDLIKLMNMYDDAVTIRNSRNSKRLQRNINKKNSIGSKLSAIEEPHAYNDNVAIESDKKLRMEEKSKNVNTPDNFDNHFMNNAPTNNNLLPNGFDSRKPIDIHGSPRITKSSVYQDSSQPVRVSSSKLSEITNSISRKKSPIYPRPSVGAKEARRDEGTIRSIAKSDVRAKDTDDILIRRQDNAKSRKETKPIFIPHAKISNSKVTISNNKTDLVRTTLIEPYSASSKSTSEKPCETDSVTEIEDDDYELARREFSERSRKNKSFNASQLSFLCPSDVGCTLEGVNDLIAQVDNKDSQKRITPLLPTGSFRELSSSLRSDSGIIGVNSVGRSQQLHLMSKSPADRSAMELGKANLLDDGVIDEERAAKTRLGMSLESCALVPSASSGSPGTLSGIVTGIAAQSVSSKSDRRPSVGNRSRSGSYGNSTSPQIAANVLGSAPPIEESGELKSFNDFTEKYRKKYGINPFREQEGKKFLKARTHNRRRWTHVFPTGDKNEGWHIQHTLNMKSLCQPAMLPLTTDYLPSPKDIEGDQHPYSHYGVQGTNQFTESNYTLILDPAVCPYTTPENLLMEMVSQRLAQEFQLIRDVDINQYKKLIHGLDDSDKSEESLYDTSDKSHFYVLSMGHRIQFLAYVPSRREVKVSRYVTTGQQSVAKYEYEIWVPQLQQFQRVSQTFRQFPEPEYNWNVHDQILLGNLDSLPETIKPKRLRYAIVPELLQTQEDMDLFYNNFKDLLSFFHKYFAEGEEIKIDREENSSFYILPSQMSQFDNSFEHLKDATRSLNVAFQSNVVSGKRKQSTTNTIKLWLRGPRHDNPKWLCLKYDSKFSHNKVFHIEFYWIVGDPWSIEDFISQWFRRGQKLKINIVQVPEYFCEANMQIHPFRAMPYIAASLPSPDDQIFGDIYNKFNSMEYRSLFVEKCVLVDFPGDWIADDDRKTDWSAYLLLNSTSSALVTSTVKSGVGAILSEHIANIASTSSKMDSSSHGTDNASNRSIPSRRVAPKVVLDRQYLHRSGLACVRIVPSGGFVWMLNSAARISDSTISIEEKKEKAAQILRDFQNKLSTALINLKNHHLHDSTLDAK